MVEDSFLRQKQHFSLSVRCCRACPVFFDSSCRYRPDGIGAPLLYDLLFPAGQSHYRWLGGSGLDVHPATGARQKIWLSDLFSCLWIHLGFMAYPAFFIPGTNHGEGLTNFWMFTVQLFAFRFFHGALYRISGKGWVFMSVFFHTLFNAASPLLGTMTMTWAGTIAANAAVVLVSIGTVMLYNHRIGRMA